MSQTHEHNWKYYNGSGLEKCTDETCNQIRVEYTWEQFNKLSKYTTDTAVLHQFLFSRLGVDGTDVLLLSQSLDGLIKAAIHEAKSEETK